VVRLLRRPLQHWRFWCVGCETRLFFALSLHQLFSSRLGGSVHVRRVLSGSGLLLVQSVPDRYGGGVSCDVNHCVDGERKCQ
jgi:hypothetical protein